MWSSFLLSRIALASGALSLALAAAGAAQSVKLSTPLTGNRDVIHLEVSADGRWVVYQADVSADDVFELFSVEASGRTPPRQIGPRARSFVLGADSRFVVYTSDAGLFVTEIDGRATRPLTSQVPPAVWIAPDGATVVFLTSEGLFRVPVDGHAAPALVQSSTPSHVHSASVTFTPDGRRVLYITEGSVGGSGLFYSALLDGSQAPVRLNDASTPASIG